MTEIPLLVTTALENTWGSTGHIVFLGEWCRLYDRRTVWGERSHEVVPNHWDDRQKLRRDHDYLRQLHSDLLNELTATLNRYHGIERPRRFWQMLLDPWLVTYVAVVFDRWERVRSAFDRHATMATMTLPHVTVEAPPDDYNTFVQTATRSHQWNHVLVARVIEATYSDRCAIERSERPLDQQVEAEARELVRVATAVSTSRAFRVAAQADALLGKVFRRNRVTLVSTYFRFKALLSINKALHQVPRLFFDDFSESVIVPEKSQRSVEDLSVAIAPRNDFEKFLFNRLARDIPRAHIERFPRLLDRARRIPIVTRAICTANAHWGNELFKVWSAEQTTMGVKFATMDHGGSIPPRFDVMNFEEEISDVRTVWTIPHQPNHVRLPPNKLVSRTFESTRQFCSVIGNEMPLYSYRATAAPITEQCLVSFRQVCDLYTAACADVQQAFRVKPYPNIGWNTRQRFRDVLGDGRVYDEPNYYHVLAQSRVVVCTYPNTTFSEALATGLPTILLYPSHLWETIPEMDGLLGTLREARIVFDDPKAAAERLDEIWNDPEGAWNESRTVAARQEMFRHCLDLDNDWLAKWTAFLKQLAE